MNKEELYELEDNDHLVNESPRNVENGSKNYIAALDIGTTKIVAIIGIVSDDGKVNILGVGKALSKGVKRGIVLNIEDTAEAIKEAVSIAERQSKLSFDEVYVGIAGRHIRSIKNNNSKNIESKDGEITQKDIDQLKQDMYNIGLNNGEEIIHVIPLSYTVDNESGIKKPIGMFGKRIHANFHVVVGETASMKYITKSVERAGLKVKDLILEPLASSAAVVSEDEKEVGVAMIDIGGGTTDIAIYYDGMLRHTAVVSLGGDAVTNDIKETCSILHRQAEKLKVQYGMALGDAAPENSSVSVPGISGRDPKSISISFLAKIIQSRMEDIIDCISFELENSGYAKKIGAGITITGGGASLKYLKQLLAYKTSLDVHVGYPNRCLTRENEDINQPTYSTSIGLLLTGYLNQKYDMQVREYEEDEEDDLEEETYKNMEESPANKFRKIINGLFEDRGKDM